LVIFDVKWYKLQMNEHDPNKNVIKNDNGFKMVNKGHLSEEHITTFSQANVNTYFT